MSKGCEVYQVGFSPEYTVEVFDVGVEQISDLVRDGHLRDFTHDGMYVPCDGDYVVVECAGCLGYVSRPRLVVSYVSLDKALAAAAAYLARDAHAAYAHEYEVWHVVDDFDLWCSWVARVREAKIDVQRKASTCRISLDNGHTFLDPVRDDVDLQELIEHLDENPYDWDGIVVSAMDDETREFTHLTSSYTGMMPNKCMSTAKINAMWLCDYLMNAEQDLIW